MLYLGVQVEAFAADLVGEVSKHTHTYMYIYIYIYIYIYTHTDIYIYVGIHIYSHRSSIFDRHHEDHHQHYYDTLLSYMLLADVL